MCGIWAIFGSSDKDLLQYFIPAYNKIHHRGPDAWRVENDHHFKNCCLGFHRLAIVDDKFGMQPMRLKRYPHIWVIANCEIYNCERLGEEFGFPYETKCDVEAIIHTYAEWGIAKCPSLLDGVFAFCLVDTDKRKVFHARDTFGVRPAFTLRSQDGFLAVSSEAKGLMDLTKGLRNGFSIDPMLPGHYAEYDLLEDGHVKHVETKRFHKIGDPPEYRTLVPASDLSSVDVHANIRTLFTAAIKKRLMAHRRIGCLLSGGLDSSLVAAILLNLSKEESLPYPIQTFSVGMESSPDVMAARRVAHHIGSDHHEVIFSEEDAINVIRDVIYHLETYDITTIRASIGMHLVSRYIQTRTDSIVIFSGEGSDEVAQGYIYFRDSPTPQDGDAESRRLLQDLYHFDVLRCDRTTAAHGLEMRVPFLDHQFTAYYLSLPEELRQPKDTIEKHLLRSAFTGTGLLPDDILWRPKEAFSDGVASLHKSLFTVLQDHIESLVTAEELVSASSLYPFNTPKTKESYYYRKVFEENFPGQTHFTPYFWMPKWTDAKDPSARFIAHYNGTADR